MLSREVLNDEHLLGLVECSGFEENSFSSFLSFIYCWVQPTYQTTLWFTSFLGLGLEVQCSDISASMQAYG